VLGSFSSGCSRRSSKHVRRAVSKAKERIAGLWILEAPDLDAALELAAEGSKH
jgi:hypothetical protein